HVRNVGRTQAGPSRARLFDGAPQLGNAVADADVPPLPAAGEAEGHFEFPTANRAGTRILYVVADADGAVSEARADDNVASRSLSVEGPQPDLVVAPGGVAVSPYPPESAETVQVSVTALNLGERQAGASRLRLVDGNPRLGGKVVGEAALPPIVEGGAA